MSPLVKGFLALLALMGVIVLSTQAFAQQTFEQGKVYPISTIACDTFEQTHAIFSTHETQGAAHGVATFRSLNRERNQYGEPACGTINGAYVLGDIRGSYTIDGKTAYIVELAIPTTGRVLFAMWQANLTIVPPDVTPQTSL